MMSKIGSERPGTGQSPSAEELRTAYEGLREQTLKSTYDGRGELGLTLLMRQGMAVWIAASSSGVPRTIEPLRKPATGGGAVVGVATALQQEVAMLVASMVLRVSHREVNPWA
jgi:hypothetical protein